MTTRMRAVILAATLMLPLNARAADLVVWWGRYTVAPPWRVGLTAAMLLGVFTVAVALGG
jgi:hypothetical protein